MSAIRGAESLVSSPFMGEENGGDMLLGIQCLMRLNEAQPHAIYWCYSKQLPGEGRAGPRLWALP